MDKDVEISDLSKNNYSKIIRNNKNNDSSANMNLIYCLFLFNILTFLFLSFQINFIKNQINETIINNINKINHKINSLNKGGAINFIDYKKIKDIIDEVENESLKIILNIISEINNKIKINYSNTNNTINKEENILTPYIKEQNEFCDNPSLYYNPLIEENIKMKTIKINELSYKMYMHKFFSFYDKSFLFFNSYEEKEVFNMMNALKYYGYKKNISNNKDIYILDIGGNIGWFPNYFGKYGYSILSFEPFELNYYISRKNYCHFNRNSNIIIINKGIYDKEKICDYYSDKINLGTGMVICDKNNLEGLKAKNEFQKTNQVQLTQLSNFIPYLSDKNIAVIKIDIDGGEEKAILGGIELITKFHVPFIFAEFTPSLLKEHDTEPINFLKLFIDNGYRVSLEGFLNSTIISIDEVMKKVDYTINCYFIYQDFF